jgi:flagellar protein FlgJ
MDIGSIGAFQLDKTRFEVADTFAINPKAQTSNPNFNTLLEKSFDKTGETKLAAPHTPPNIDKTDKLYEQCEALETFFLKTLISSMRKTVDKTSALNDSGFAGGMYEDMLYDEYTKSFAKNSGFGFADMAYMELTGQRGKLINNKPAGI